MCGLLPAASLTSFRSLLLPPFFPFTHIAIEFVLSDKYSNLRNEEKIHLLHEGSGHQASVAMVEIIFDNADGRIPVEKKDTVSLRRVMGAKKDEYFLDSRHMNRSDIVNLLESAGMSRSNPYYIVQQGKVSKLIKMKDSERLQLLQEIAGTRTYDERRLESEKIMHATEEQRLEVEEVIQTLDRRLKELDDERSALKDYQKADNDRRSLEYTTWARKAQALTDKLTALEESQASTRKSTDEAHKAAELALKERVALEEGLRALTEQLAFQKAHLVSVERDYNEQMRIEAECKYKVTSLQEREASNVERQVQTEKELKNIDKEVSNVQSQLDKITPQLQHCVQEEEQAKRDVNMNEQRHLALTAKQGRYAQFTSKAARDKFLKTQIKTVETELANERKQMDRAVVELQESKARLAKLTSQVDDARKQLAALEEKRLEINTKYKATRASIDTAQNKRRELWRAQESLEAAERAAVASLDSAQRTAQHAMDRETYRGLESVRAYLREHPEIAGVHGPLIDLFQTERPMFDGCVEAVAGNSLFHVVVDNDNVAQTIIQHLVATHGGRVTFMPLNRLRVEEVRYPPSNDGIPMIQKLKFDDVYRPALFQVFGKTVIVRDIENGCKIARDYNLDCITVGCERVNKRGALTGGFQEAPTARLSAMRARAASTRAAEEATRRLTEAKQAAMEEDQVISRMMGELSSLSQELSRVKTETEQVQTSSRDAEAERRALEKSMSLRESQSVQQQGLVGVLESRRTQLEDELNSEFAENLSDAEKMELVTLAADAVTLKKALLAASEARLKAQEERDSLFSRLEAFLLPKQTELRETLATTSVESNTTAIDAATRDHKASQHAVKESGAAWTAAQEEIKSLTAQVAEKTQLLDQKRTAEQGLIRQAAESSRGAEELLGKRLLYEQQREACQARIRELGLLPQDALNKHAKKTQKQIDAELENVNSVLNKFQHVNKKAIDQYLNARQQKEDLLKRKEELDASRASLEGLIQSLDMKKEEEIDRTFKAIGLQFTQAFNELVPHGKGTLVLHTSDMIEGAGGDEGEEDEGKVPSKSARGGGKKGASSSKSLSTSTSTSASSSGSSGSLGKISFTGVGIQVNFGGSDQTNTSLLSGGQQSVVALALIFAIQRCDPSPFYLFDEIDANLDGVHRTAVAQMINKLKSTTQFISTTFRPEFLQTADKFYGVQFRDKASQVRVISKAEAEELVHNAAKEMMAGAGAGAGAAAAAAGGPGGGRGRG